MSLADETTSRGELAGIINRRDQMLRCECHDLRPLSTEKWVVSDEDLTLCSCKVCQAGPDYEVMKGPDHVEIGEAEGIVGVHDGCRDELRAGWRIATEQR